MRTRPWPSGTALLVALLGAAPVHAQVSLSVDATAATVHYDGFLRSGVILLTPVVRVDQPQFSLIGRGTFSLFESGNYSTDVVLAGSVFTPRLEGWQGELTADGGVSRYLQNNIGYGSIGARVHHSRPLSGLWMGLEGVSVTGGTAAIGSSRGEIGGWMRSGPLALSASLTRTAWRDVASYVDLGVHGRWDRDWLQLTASLGARGGDSTGGVRRWGDASATMWLSRRLAVVIGHGAYPVDLAQIAPGGRYSALSLRFGTRPPALRDALARTVRTSTASIVRPVVATFDARRNRDGTVRIRVRAPGAARVELAGDFTDWDPVGLERGRGDTWEVSLPLSSGTYRFNIRVNGGEWGVPPGVGTTPDEFGGVVALLLVS